MFDPPAGVFLVARDAGWWAAPVLPDRPSAASGCAPSAPGAGEVKRLWVDPTWRGAASAGRSWRGSRRRRGASGLEALRLDTGDRQPEAVALYESTGWERVHVGGDGRPLHAVPLPLRQVAGGGR